VGGVALLNSIEGKLITAFSCFSYPLTSLVSNFKRSSLFLDHLWSAFRIQLTERLTDLVVSSDFPNHV